MKHCYGYIRISDPKQGKGVSLEAQKDEMTRYAERKDIRIINWFEETRTAAKSGRPVFARMMKLLKQRKAEGVVIHKVDRSARNLGDWAHIGELSDEGIDIHIVSETLDFRSRGGRLSADIQAVIAADYIRNLREEAYKGLYGRLKQGLYPFNAPIGYLDNGGGTLKSHDPKRAPLIKEALELYASGQYSYCSLLEKMTARGLRNRNGRPLTRTGLAAVLSNPFYCGVMLIRTTGETFPGKHEPLISAATFEAIQAVRSGKYAKIVTRHKHTYRGLFRCGLCNTTMIPERQKGHVYYRCHTASCETKTVREEKIESGVRGLLAKLTFPKEYVSALCAELERWFAQRSCDTNLKSITLQLGQTDVRLTKLEDAAINGIIDHDGFNKRKRSILLKRKKLEEERDKIQKSEHTPDKVRQLLELYKSLVASYDFVKPHRKREIVEFFTSNRTVSGRNVYLEPSNWLAAANDTLGVLAGPPHHTTSRTNTALVEKQIEQLTSSEATRALELFTGAQAETASARTSNHYTDHEER